VGLLCYGSIKYTENQNILLEGVLVYLNILYF